MTYPETFDTTGPASLDDAYAYLNWASVSVHRALAGAPETGWELLPGLLGEVWGDPDWYQRNEWLADFYNTVYHHASTVEPAQIFAVDEIGEPAAELARVIDSVVQGWTTAHLAAEADPQEYESYESQGYESHGYESHGYEGYDQHDQYPEQQYAEQPAEQQYPEQQYPEQPDEEQHQELLTELDPTVAREALARVVDDEADDLSPADQQILATVLTVERFQYLAREFDLV